MAASKEKASSVQAVSRALRILEAFTPQRPELSLNDFSKITGFYKSTILRQLETLIQEGFLVRDHDSGRYRLGAKVYVLGQIFVKSSDLLRLADPVLKQVVEKVEETAGIFVIDGIERLCLKTLSGHHFIRATFEAGQRMPIYAGASGKILLAFSPSSFLQRVIKETGLKRLTELTITDPSALKAELAKIRKHGWAVSWGERVQSAVTASVPVFGNDGRIVCSLSISGPADRLTQKIMPDTIRVLQQAGKQLSRDLGYYGTKWDKFINMPIIIQ